MTDYIDGLPKSEINDFRNDYLIRPRDSTGRNCEFCNKDLTNQISKFTTDFTKRVGFKKYEIQTIYYCSDCKAKNNM